VVGTAPPAKAAKAARAAAEELEQVVVLLRWAGRRAPAGEGQGAGPGASSQVSGDVRLELAAADEGGPS
jgi:hypothetical protein